MVEEEGNSQTTLLQHKEKPKNSKRIKSRVKRGETYISLVYFCSL